MMNIKKVAFEGFEYDDELFVETGIYDFIENGINGYPMILVNGKWLDLCAIEELECMYIK